MRRAGLFAVIVWLAVSLPAASMMRAERTAGWTWISGAVDSSGWEFAVSRSLLSRVDVAVVVGSQAPLRLEWTAGVLDLVPFRVSIGYRAGRLACHGSVHLGPVRLALERDIARRGVARWTVAAAVAPRIAVVAEGALRAANPEVELSLMAFSAAPPLTACSISIAAHRLRLSAGVGW